jgi:hypothetical protein
MILMAKSEIRTIHVWWTVENLVFQHTGGRENDFASSIKYGQEPNVGSLAASVGPRLVLFALIAG